MEEAVALKQKMFPNDRDARAFEFGLRRNGFQTWHYRVGEYRNLDELLNTPTIVEWIEY